VGVLIQAVLSSAGSLTGDVRVGDIQIQPYLSGVPNAIPIWETAQTLGSATPAQLVADIGAMAVQNATLAAGLSGTPNLPTGTTINATPATSDNSTKAQTTAGTLAQIAANSLAPGSRQLNFFCAGTVGTGNATAYYLIPGSATTGTGCTGVLGSPLIMSQSGTITGAYVFALVGGAQGSGSGTPSGVMTIVHSSPTGTNGNLTATTSSTTICTLGAQATSVTGRTQCSNTSLSIAFAAGDGLQVSVTTGQATDTTANVSVALKY
jgi:hypothetical protein